jgi:hypothetical protein
MGPVDQTISILHAPTLNSDCTSIKPKITFMEFLQLTKRAAAVARFMVIVDLQ